MTVPNRALFIVGCPRSGTTLLQSLLACTPGLTTFRESHLFSRALMLRAGRAWPRRDLTPEITRFWEDNALPAAQTPLGLSGIDRLRSARVADQALNTLCRASAVREAAIFVEKTPRHLHFIPQIRAAAQRRGLAASFIHLVRDGVAVAASLTNASQHWSHSQKPFEALARWQADMDRSATWMSTPDQHFVTYEALTQSPQEQMLRLAAEMALPLTRDDLQNRGTALTQIIRPDETWKSVDTGTEIKSSTRASSHLDPDTLAQLERQIDRSVYARIAAWTQAEHTVAS